MIENHGAKYWNKDFTMMRAYNKDKILKYIMKVKDKAEMEKLNFY
jgi:hypothetical protein